MQIKILSQARTPEFEGTEDVDWSSVDKSLANYIDGFFRFAPDAERPDEEIDITDEANAAIKSWIASKTLLGDPEAEDARNLIFFPVVNPETNNLNANALRAVLSGRGAQADIPETTLNNARLVARELLESEFNEEPEEERSIEDLIDEINEMLESLAE